MKRIIPVTDLQRQAGQVLNSLSDSDEPVIVTQRGRASAVLISAERYTRIESGSTSWSCRRWSGMPVRPARPATPSLTKT